MQNLLFYIVLMMHYKTIVTRQFQNTFNKKLQDYFSCNQIIICLLIIALNRTPQLHIIQNLKLCSRNFSKPRGWTKFNRSSRWFGHDSSVTSRRCSLKGSSRRTRSLCTRSCSSATWRASKSRQWGPLEALYIQLSVILFIIYR